MTQTETIKQQLEKSGYVANNITISRNNEFIDFANGNVNMWAKLTRTGKLKKHSVRVSTY